MRRLREDIKTVAFVLTPLSLPFPPLLRFALLIFALWLETCGD
jgi:hypothetical protein